MNEKEIEVCEKILAWFNKADFNLKAGQAVTMTDDLRLFAKVINDHKENLKGPKVTPPSKAEVK